MQIREYQEQDFDWLLRLNAANVPEVGIAKTEHLKRLINFSQNIFIAESENSPMGALLIMDEKQTYESSNYRWFVENSESFFYIDRIMIDQHYRGKGVGRMLYEKLFMVASEASKLRVTCEVNTEPPNPKSIAFHEKLGFQVLENRYDPTNNKKVSMFQRVL